MSDIVQLLHMTNVVHPSWNTSTETDVLSCLTNKVLSKIIIAGRIIELGHTRVMEVNVIIC